ncbi:MAG: tripartite tricarboxylate transporter substrate binding protein [Betaproteobacteria bacterium]|nr:tripartite tricarboxylate transporter substrate binding protein [Betaproteobacteria bacterium]MDE2358364.1 tripartite tricarboxylate transporter substrate binding protein [Betaproteobacteria bacterium]
MRAARATEGGAYPNRPVRLILPSTIGGTSDLLARLIGARLGDALGQPIVIEARPGAAGRIAVDYVAGSPPDGYTLLLANNGANAIAAAGRDSAEAATRFAPVTMLAQLPIVVAVTPALGIDTLQELIRRARAAPGSLFYASGGAGSTSYTAGALLFERAGVHLVDVPYAGTSVAVKDVLSGQVPVLFTHLGTVATLIQAGRLRALAVTGAHRMADFPDLPTAAESGFPGFDVTTWHGIVAPLGTPRRILARLHDELVRLVGLPDVRRQLAAMGMEPVGDTPEEFATAIAADIRQWTIVLRAVRTRHP